MAYSKSKTVRFSSRNYLWKWLSPSNQMRTLLKLLKFFQSCRNLSLSYSRENKCPRGVISEQIVAQIKLFSWEKFYPGKKKSPRCQTDKILFRNIRVDGLFPGSTDKTQTHKQNKSRRKKPIAFVSTTWEKFCHFFPVCQPK